MVAAVALRPPWFPAPGAAAHNNQPMIVDKSMLLKVEDLIDFTFY
jgi:hypothetical protein